MLQYKVGTERFNVLALTTKSQTKGVGPLVYPTGQSLKYVVLKIVI